MEITRIRIFPFDTRSTQGQTRGYAEIEIDGKLVIRGIRIMESKSGGLFLGWPSQKTSSGAFRDLIEISDAATSKLFRDSIIDAFSNFGDEHSGSDARENHS